MKLFLASSLDQTLGLLEAKLKKPATECKVLFVANAADPFEDQWWVDLDRQKFLGAGYRVVETDLRKLTREELSKSLEGADIIHICGGSVFYLLAIIKKGGFDKVIENAVREGRVMYTGTSAGSIIASKSTEVYKYDPDEVKFADKVSDFSGLGLIDFVIVPHCGNRDFVEANKAVVEHLPEFPFPMIFLHDTHAVYIEGEKLEILSRK